MCVKATLFKQKYDAVVGDITITANRTIYVDFTVPYVESGVSMIVPIQHEITKGLWWFTKPFKWHVWLTIFVLLGAKGFLVWLFERENNEEFQGPWQKQLGTTFYFSFSLFHFSQSKLSLPVHLCSEQILKDYKELNKLTMLVGLW